MLEKSLKWIKYHTLPGEGVMITSRLRVSYPEVTGYLIPTLLSMGESELARQFALWLATIQRHDGAFGGESDEHGYAFATGQVIRGWTRLLKEIPQLEQSLRRACDWLIDTADPQSGRLVVPPAGAAWSLGPRGEVNEGIHLHVLAPLRLSGELLNEPSYIRFVDKSVDYYLREANLTDFLLPNSFTHYFAYVQEALLELDCGDEARAGMKSAAPFQQSTGAVPGYNDTSWICATGQAQLAQLWYRLGERDRADAALDFMKMLQNPSGGFFGSYGVGADYYPAEEVTLAAKFYVDASREAVTCHEQSAPLSYSANVEDPCAHNSGKGGTSVVRQLQRATKTKILLVVCLYENNFGDILIHKTIDKKLRQAGFETEHVEISDGLNRSRLIERANNCQFLYFVGGGIIERWAPEIITSFDRLHPWLKIPYGVVGLSTGNFDYSRFHHSLKVFSEKAGFFYTRDKDSIETFRKAGARKLPQAGVDVVFASDEISALRTTGRMRTAHFRNVPYIDVTGDLDWPRWSAALRKIGVESLVPDCSQAQKQLGIPIDTDSPIGQISKSEIVVAMRFHTILVASMMGSLTIPINYCPKIKRLSQQLGIGPYCLELSDHDKLEATFQQLISEKQDVLRVVGNNVKRLKLRANSIIANTIKVLEAL
jgi:polysaccharide pyruvyl transferase WcaK-like protein